jgi:hypothetical protein
VPCTNKGLAGPEMLQEIDAIEVRKKKELEEKVDDAALRSFFVYFFLSVSRSLLAPKILLFLFCLSRFPLRT